jgi:hypothetical protein
MTSLDTVNTKLNNVKSKGDWLEAPTSQNPKPSPNQEEECAKELSSNAWSEYHALKARSHEQESSFKTSQN